VTATSRRLAFRGCGRSRLGAADRNANSESTTFSSLSTPLSRTIRVVGSCRLQNRTHKKAVPPNVSRLINKVPSPPPPPPRRPGSLVGDLFPRDHQLTRGGEGFIFFLVGGRETSASPFVRFFSAPVTVIYVWPRTGARRRVAVDRRRRGRAGAVTA